MTHTRYGVSKLEDTYASCERHVAAGRWVIVLILALARGWVHLLISATKSSFRELKYGRFGAGAQDPPVDAKFQATRCAAMPLRSRGHSTNSV